MSEIGYTKVFAAVEQGYQNWARNPHNRRWANMLDGTPAPNDILVNIALEVVRLTNQQRVEP
jgi:hypothetical protein